jgi:hypothetical protein
MPRPTVVLAVLVLAALLGGSCAAPAGAATDDLPVVRYQPPVDGPVVDHFDLPDQPWQPGNRGIDYGPEPGTPVAAAADGRVVFAGPVAGALHVTVEHADGLRTSYSFLAEVRVRVGQRVGAGDVVGVAGGPFHFGVRTPDGTYLDPEALLAGTLRPHVRLVPGAEDGLAALGAERRSLLGTLFDTGAAAVAYVADHGGDWARLAVHYANELQPMVHVARAVEAGQEWVRQRLHCTQPSTAVGPPAERRIAVLVSGLGTDSGGNSAWEVDTTALGYADADVVRFSYAGGRAPGPGVDRPAATPVRARAGAVDSLDDIPVTEFTAADSQQDLRTSAARLEELLAEVAAAEPGVPIDVIAHSQGGVVARLGVVTAGADGRLPGTVDNLVTIGSPHQGAPAATGITALQQSPGGQGVLDAVRWSGAADELDDQRPAIPQLSETSDVLADMRATPIPDGVRFTSLGASGDLVVPGTATADPQADAHVLVPTRLALSAHGELASLPATTREVSLAISGRDPTCRSLGDAARAFTEAEVVRYAETTVAVEAAASGVEGSQAVLSARALTGAG